MQRRVFLLSLWAARLAAQAKDEILELFTKIASEMSADNPLIFVDAVDHDMPHFQDFQNNLTALIAQADVTNSLEVLSDTGDDDHRVEQVDWFMQIVSKADPTSVERRRDVITFRLERRGKKRKWKIVSIDPLNFFRPPK